MMARDPAWTEQLGNAVLVERPDVMDAIQQIASRRNDVARRDTGPLPTSLLSDNSPKTADVDP
jgi:hypothetical protein